MLHWSELHDFPSPFSFWHMILLRNHKICSFIIPWSCPSVADHLWTPRQRTFTLMWGTSLLHDVSERARVGRKIQTEQQERTRFLSYPTSTCLRNFNLSCSNQDQKTKKSLKIKAVGSYSFPEPHNLREESGWPCFSEQACPGPSSKQALGAS